MNRLGCLLLVASLVTGCGHDSTGGSNPPADHGRYAGKAAHWYDVAYRSCYQQLDQMSRPSSDGVLLGTLLMKPAAAHYMKAMNEGCSDAAQEAVGVAGFMGTLSSTSP